MQINDVLKCMIWLLLPIRHTENIVVTKTLQHTALDRFEYRKWLCCICIVEDQRSRYNFTNFYVPEVIGIHSFI